MKWPDVELNECRIKRERSVPFELPGNGGFSRDIGKLPEIRAQNVIGVTDPSRLIRHSFNSTFGNFTF